ncbi:MAG TPA: histidine kinase, partial [Cyclobacteriaceae bacterium]|nr:histidine kinase [Cyclobacteriaceae bacterium]
VRLARDAELSNLRQQLQPHFLFNSLNSISALAGSQPTEARKMIQQLSDFLRGTIRKDDKSLVTLEEELHHLQLYLDIEKVRFGHRLNTQIDKTPDSLGMQLPSLLLQPIVENAIKFGLYDTVGEIGISIAARVENNALVIEVKNPFDPATATPQRGTGFGLSSVQRRLSLMYFRNDLLSTSQSDNIFTTTVKIPQKA